MGGETKGALTRLELKLNFVQLAGLSKSADDALTTIICNAINSVLLSSYILVT